MSKSKLEEEVKLRTNELQLAKARAEVQANTDELTGIHNRRSFMQQAEMRLKLAARQEQNCTLFMSCVQDICENKLFNSRAKTFHPLDINLSQVK